MGNARPPMSSATSCHGFSRNSPYRSKPGVAFAIRPLCRHGSRCQFDAVMDLQSLHSRAHRGHAPGTLVNAALLGRLASVPVDILIIRHNLLASAGCAGN